MQALLNDLKYAAALSLKGETKMVTKQHQQHNRPCLPKEMNVCTEIKSGISKHSPSQRIQKGQ